MAVRGGGGVSSFTPPTVRDSPNFLPDSTQDQKDLWSHFRLRDRGVNVWVMSDGSVRQDTATAENKNTNMDGVYPWNPNNPGGPYVTAYYIDATANPQTSSAHTTSHAVYPTAFFPAGTTTPITAAMVTLLTNYTAFGTGYGGDIT